MIWINTIPPSSAQKCHEVGNYISKATAVSCRLNSPYYVYNFHKSEGLFPDYKKVTVEIHLRRLGFGLLLLLLPLLLQELGSPACSGFN
jgi:hypothetical protein